jgi:uncharacterized membrane protein
MDRSLTGMKWVLLASLLVNAAFLGFAVAQITGRGFGPRPPMMMQQMARPNGPNQALPEKTRAVLNEALTNERPAMEKALREWIDARRKTVAILRAEPLDQKELDAAMEQMRVKTIAAQEIYHRTISGAAIKLDADERVALARILDPTPARFGPNGPFEGSGLRGRGGLGQPPAGSPPERP